MNHYVVSILVLVAGLLSQSAALLADVVRPFHTDDTLRVLTLNIAHGRGEALNQILVGRKTALNNLDEIALLMQRSMAQVVGLQEIDAPSLWSRNINQPEHIAGRSGYTEVVHSVHAESVLYEYGTALLSRLAFSDRLDHTFAPSPPTTEKGFSLAQVAWQTEGGETVLVDVVSVHLDFSRRQVRQSQSDEIREVLLARGNPIILMGDFNSDWSDKNDAVRQLSDTLGLIAFRPDATDLGTYDDGEKRLDWILVSTDFSFDDYQVMPQSVSDHRAVVANIRLNPTGEAN